MVPKFTNTVRVNQDDVDRFQAGLSGSSGCCIISHYRIGPIVWKCCKVIMSKLMIISVIMRLLFRVLLFHVDMPVISHVSVGVA